MHISVTAERIFTAFSWPVSNTMITAWIAIALVSFASYSATRRMSPVPGKLQNIFEYVIEELFTLVNNFMGDRQTALRYFPLIATFFLFILSVNLLGLLPGFGSVGFFEEGKLVPLFRSTNADLNTTLALAFIAVISIQISGIMALGFFKYWNKFITFTSPLAFFIGAMELVSEAAKLVSFSFRLFGSIFAGEVLLTVLAFLVPYVLPVPFLAFEVFIGFIQAFVFMLLTAVFIKMAITAHEA